MKNKNRKYALLFILNLVFMFVGAFLISRSEVSGNTKTSLMLGWSITIFTIFSIIIFLTDKKKFGQ